MMNTVVARIDLGAFQNNLKLVSQLCPQSRIMAVVKADAYGHGLIPVAKALESADGFAVARLQEAICLRRSGIGKRILLLATLLDEAGIRLCMEQEIDVTAHDRRSVSLIAGQSERGPLRVWLKLDSGMHRAGLDSGAFTEADALLSRKSGIRELIHMTHFCSAGERSAVTRRQLASLYKCRTLCSSAEASLANSAALLSDHDTHAEWVRPGIMLYGVNPLGNQPFMPLRVAMTLSAKVIAVREIGAGQSVGYSSRWTSTRPSRIATVGIGYGDGYPRHAADGTPVLINSQVAPLAGRVSMDSLTVDVTDCDPVAIGDEAILWGATLPAAVVAEHAGTIPWELFTSLGSRVPREYLNVPEVSLRECSELRERACQPGM